MSYFVFFSRDSKAADEIKDDNEVKGSVNLDPSRS